MKLAFVFVTEIEALSEDMQNISFKINTDYEKINNLSEKLSVCDTYNKIKEGFDGDWPSPQKLVLPIMLVIAPFEGSLFIQLPEIQKAPWEDWSDREKPAFSKTE